MAIEESECDSCNGNGTGPVGVYSPRVPPCGECQGLGYIRRCRECGFLEDDCDCDNDEKGAVMPIG